MTEATASPEAPQRYSALTRVLHWIVAILILGMIPAGIIMVQDGLPRPVQNSLFIFHKNFGVVVLLLMLMRLAWRLVRPAPPLPPSMPDWQQRVAAISHTMLYVLAVAVPVAGYVRVKADGFPIESLDAMGVPSLVPRSKELATTAKALHYYGGLALAGLVLLHIGAALQHGLFKRDGIFSRMWPPLGGGSSAPRDADAR
ncbi:MAG: cytochrome b/b6 domain-containing protein [Pseudomonadota bacterium]